MLQPIESATATTGTYRGAGHARAPTEELSRVIRPHLRLVTRARKEPETTDPDEFQRLHPLTYPEPEPDRLEEPSQEDKLGADLLSYGSLTHGWDGYDGVPASFSAVQDALNFLTMKPEDIPLPYPQIAPDGEVGLYWRTEEIYAEVGFYGDGTYSYYARYRPPDGEPIEAGQDGCSLTTGAWSESLLIVPNKIAK